MTERTSAPAPLMTIDDVAEHLQCSKRTVYRLVDNGSIPRPVRLGSLMRWNRSAFEQWIAAGCPSVRRAGPP